VSLPENSKVSTFLAFPAFNVSRGHIDQTDQSNSRLKINPMSYIVKLIDPLTDPRWDQFVESHPYGWICHLSGWKRILEDSFKHLKGYYFVLLKKDRVEAALPVFEVRSWLRGDRLVSIPFATLCDPLVQNTNQMKSLFQSVITFFRSKPKSYIEIRSLYSNQLLSSFDEIKCGNVYAHHYLPLKGDLDGIKRRFHQKSVRSAINKAQRFSTYVFLADHIDHLKTFYCLYFMTRKRLRLPPQPFMFFENIWKNYFPSKFQILIAEVNKRAIGGLAFFKYKNRFSTEFAGWDILYRSFNPNHLLYWEAIKIAHSEKFEIFDFGRTSYNNQGLMDFKKRWGTYIKKIKHFYHPSQVAERLTDPMVGNVQKAVIQAAIRKNTPDPFVRMIGNFCYRHLS